MTQRIDFMKESKLVNILNNSPLAKASFLVSEVADSFSTYVGMKHHDMAEMNPTVNYVIDRLGLENGLLIHTALSLAAAGLAAGVANKYCELRGAKEKLGNLIYYGVGAGIAGRAALNVLEILQA